MKSVSDTVLFLKSISTPPSAGPVYGEKHGCVTAAVRCVDRAERNELSYKGNGSADMTESALVLA